MTDQFSICLSDFKSQLQSLTTYFPAVTGRAAGWQVSENDLIVMEGSDYFITLRPGNFDETGTRVTQENEWHVITNIFMRFSEYEGLWTAFRVFRSDILGLTKTNPLTAHGIWFQKFSAQGEPQFLTDKNTGEYLGLVVQTIDTTIKQRVRIR